MILQTIKNISLTGKSVELQNITNNDISILTIDDYKLLHDILMGPHVALALVLLEKLGFFNYTIPEIQECINIKTSKHFKEIWPHTIKVINQTPPKLTIRWAAFFHDLGKAQSFRLQQGKVTFHHHEKKSAKIFSKFASKFDIFTPGQYSCIYFLIANLGYVEGYEYKWTDSAVRRFAKEMGIYLDDLLVLSSADITTGNNARKEKILKKIDDLKNRIKTIQEEDDRQKLLPKGLGLYISQQLNIPVGPEIGVLRKILEEKVNSGILLPNLECDYYINYLKENIVEENCQ